MCQEIHCLELKPYSRATATSKWIFKPHQSPPLQALNLGIFTELFLLQYKFPQSPALQRQSTIKSMTQTFFLITVNLSYKLQTQGVFVREVLNLISPSTSHSSLFLLLTRDPIMLFPALLPRCALVFSLHVAWFSSCQATKTLVKCLWSGRWSNFPQVQQPTHIISLSTTETECEISTKSEGKSWQTFEIPGNTVLPRGRQNFQPSSADSTSSFLI